MNTFTKLISSVVVILGITFTPIANSGNSPSGVKIIYIQVKASLNQAVVFINNNVNGSPTCVTAATNRMAFALSSDAYRAMLAAAQTSMYTGKTVRLFGTNNCNVAGGIESMKWLQVDD